MNKNYVLKRDEYIKEIDSQVYLYEHTKTKAQVLYIANEDSHKTFGIGFRTPPQDSTGIAHIIEHSVLCGSKKYPLKDPFVELAKGSLNTYLNAMTYPDKTLYPISSENATDFRNLMDVYLDAVFFPKIYDQEYILMQEGWRYHIEDEQSPLMYKGVVYNEMKGAFSSPEEVIFRKIKETLFPDTIYSNESGGAPEHIPELTYSQFTDFHRTYYHPSNAFICLYGKMDIDQELAYIDEGYLSKFEYKAIDSSIKLQKQFDTIIERRYPYSVSEKKENQTYLAYNVIVGEATDKKLMLALSILEYILLDTPASILKRALIKEGIGEDVFSVFQTHLRQPIFSIVAKNVSVDKVERFYEVIESTLKDVVQKGIPERLLNAAIQVKEFELRESDGRGYSKGLLYFISAIKNWVYDSKPEEALKYEEALSFIKQNKANDYLTGIINEYFINNMSAAKIELYPEVNLDKKIEQDITEKLKQIKESWSDEELKKHVETTRLFNEYQSTPDTNEAKESIPLLKKEELRTEANYPRFNIREENYKYIITPLFTNKIAYINWHIDLKGIEDKYAPYLGMLVGMLGKLDTKTYAYDELTTYVDENIGGIQYDIGTRFDYNKNGYQRYFKIKTKALTNKINEQTGIMRQIITETLFEDKERLLEIVKEIKAIVEMGLGGDGHKVAVTRMLAHFTEGDRFQEETKGLSFYHFIKDIESNWESSHENFIKNLKEAYKFLGNSVRYTVGIIVDENEVEGCIKANEKELDKIPSEEIVSLVNVHKMSNIKEGLVFPGNVNYVAAGYNFKEKGYQYNGSMQMLKSILSMDYLWTKVRVENGAYGCFADFRKSGNMIFVSYRDPNVSKTLEIYKGIPKYLEEINLSERQMLQYLIGTISGLDFPYTPYTEGEAAQVYYLAGVTKEELQKSRDELFATTNETLKGFSKIVEEVLNEQCYCVFGNTTSIEENKALFDKVTTV